MGFTDILVHVDDRNACQTRLEVAGMLAKSHGARLIGLNVRNRPDLPHYIAAQYGAQIESVRDRYNAEAAERAKARFEALDLGGDVHCEWRDVEGNMPAQVCLHARYADLTVVGQTESGEPEGPLPDALLLEIGRPVLVVPYVGRFASIGERVVVAWNASREATRAVHDALPILKKAKIVHVLAVNPEGGMAGHGDIPGADLGLHLSRHGVNAVCEHIRSEDLKVGEMLLSRAADEDADLIVMGAYGRSRLRELVLGGATRHLLHHMTVPVLMSH